ncbi:LysR family transcriptional regulator [Paralcaligenes ginsengisoli]
MDWSYKIRLRNLQMLVRLCELGNMSQVAQEFNVTQPALSKWVKEFEGNVGAPLFQRHARGLTPLPLALELARQAKGIVGRLDRARAVVDYMKGPTEGQVAVGVSPMVAIALLPGVLRNFHRLHPKVFVHIREDTLDHLNSKLLSGELDLVIGRIEEGQAPPDLTHEKLCDTPLCLAVCRSHPLAGTKNVTWAQALSYPWMAPPPGSPFRNLMELTLESMNLGKPNVLVESAYIHTNAVLLEGTDLIAPMSRATAWCIQGAALEVLDLFIPYQGSVSLLWRLEDQGEQLIQDFMDCARRQSVNMVV